MTMRTFVVLLFCTVLVVVAEANSKIKGKEKKLFRRDDPFTLSFGTDSPATGTGCSYKGQRYQQGVVWQDACQYNCICENAATGRYKCTDRCPTYGKLPPICIMVKKPGQCCGKPECTFQTTGGGTSGSGTGTMTGSGTITGTGTGTVPGGSGGACVDKLSDCARYTRAVCSNHDYVPWVHDNCCAYCSGGTGGHVDGGTGTGGSSTGTCTDAIANCVDYTASVCTQSSFSTWVSKNCPRFCNKCGGGTGTGTMTGGTGTGTMTGGTGTGTITGGTGTGTMTGGTGTMTGGTGGGSSSTGGGSCRDNIANCAVYTQSTCNNAAYSTWVLDNCAHYCNKCGTGTGTGTGTFTGTGTGTGTFTGTGMGTGTFTGTGTGTGTFTGTGTGTFTGTGGTSTCMDKMDCKGYEAAMCTDTKYRPFAKENCPMHCNWCGSMTGTGTGSSTGGTGTGIITGGTGTGTMTGTGTCVDVATNCAMLKTQVRICSDAGAKVYALQNCKMTCQLCNGGSTSGTGTMTGGTGTMTGGTGTMTGGSGTCRDAQSNCKAYDKSICTSADYRQWASQHCQLTCNMCSSGGMTSGSGNVVGTGGSGMTGTGTGGTITGTGTGTGGTITGTGTGTGGTITGSSSGCVYKQKLYQQNQSWKDGCEFSCKCVDGAAGKYQCSQMCIQWQLPSQCHMTPPRKNKCCPTPSCPAGFNIQYPQGYIEQ